MRNNIGSEMITTGIAEEYENLYMQMKLGIFTLRKMYQTLK